MFNLSLHFIVYLILYFTLFLFYSVKNKHILWNEKRIISKIMIENILDVNFRYLFALTRPCIVCSLRYVCWSHERRSSTSCDCTRLESRFSISNSGLRIYIVIQSSPILFSLFESECKLK